MVAVSEAVRDYFRQIGKKGGAVKSEAKAKAAQANGRKRKKKGRSKRESSDS